MLAVIFVSDSLLSIFFDVYMNTKMKIQALVLLGKPAFEVLLGPQGVGLEGNGDRGNGFPIILCE